LREINKSNWNHNIKNDSIKHEDYKNWKITETKDKKEMWVMVKNSINK